MDDPAIICDDVTDADVKPKSNDEANSYDEKKFNEKKATSKMQSFYILLAFLWNTIALLIAVSIHCYLTKYRAIQKHLLPFHSTNNKLKI